jgi:hypothetical protein
MHSYRRSSVLAQAGATTSPVLSATSLFYGSGSSIVRRAVGFADGAGPAPFVYSLASRVSTAPLLSEDGATLVVVTENHEVAAIKHLPLGSDWSILWNMTLPGVGAGTVAPLLDNLENELWFVVNHPENTSFSLHLVSSTNGAVLFVLNDLPGSVCSLPRRKVLSTLYDAMPTKHLISPFPCVL